MEMGVNWEDVSVMFVEPRGNIREKDGGAEDTRRSMHGGKNGGQLLPRLTWS